MSALLEFERLEKTCSHFEYSSSTYYQIGPFVLRLLSVSELLTQKLTRAFAHLKLDCLSKEPDFTIYLCDTSQTEQKLPPLNWNIIHANGYRGFSEPPVYFHYFDAIGALSALHTERKKGYYIVRNPQNLPWWVSGSPLQAILHPWLREKGLQLTHTAAVGNDRAAVLLTGQGGSGKSTTTLACLRAGLHYLGEDYCILDPGAPPRIFSIYQSAKWTPQTRALFPEYEHCIANPESANIEKALVYYEDLFPKQVKRFAPIRAIVSLKVGNCSIPQIRRQDAAGCLKDLMMSTLTQLPFQHAKTMSILKDITESVERYQLVLGQELLENVRVIQDLLL